MSGFAHGCGEGLDGRVLPLQGLLGEKEDRQKARGGIVIKIFSLVKLVTACNRWQESASNTNELKDHWSFRWAGTSRGKIIKIFMASINQFTEKLAAGIQYSWKL